MWRIPLEQPPATVRLAEGLLGEDERRRAERLVARDQARRFVVARAAARLVLGGYLARPAQSLRFRYSPHGKPDLEAGLAVPLAFNVSHSGAYALLACKARGRVGVDLERIAPLDLEEIVRMALSAREAHALRSLEEPARLRGFFLGWTRKEAYLKARGQGLADAPQRVTVELDPRRPAALLEDLGDPDAPGSWSLAGLEVAEGYAAALAADERDILVVPMGAEPYLARLA